MNLKTNIIKSMCKYAGIFIFLISVYVLMLFVVFLIPDKFVEPNVNTSLGYINREGIWPQIYFFQDVSKPESQGEMYMYQEMLSKNMHYDSALKNAMDISDYARCWHGYLVIAKILTLFFEYSQLRYILMMGFFIISFMLFNEIKCKIGGGIRGGFCCCFLRHTRLQYR